MEEEYKRKCFFYKWRIENFNFCKQKTGEYLESPLFFIESSPKTSWKLWLYPRGEDDGEYISCYLFRDGGEPEVMDVDFELSVSVGEKLVKPPISFQKIYSFKNFQKEGEKSFALRREISLLKSPWEEKCTLTIKCIIFKRNGDRFEVTEHFGRTTVAMERISGMDVFDVFSDLNIEVKTLMEADPLISINLSHFDENFTIRIHPKNCEKIKYSICKITVIKNWEKKFPIEHVRSWVGEIKTDIWRYDVPLPQTESAEQDAQKIIFLHYDFAFSTGVEYANNELNDYGTDLWLENLSLLESSCENIKTEESTDYLTVMDALKPSYVSKSFADVTIKTKTTTFEAHKVVLYARSSELEEILKNNPENIELGDYSDDVIQRFLRFLYTDKVEDLYWQVAIDLYRMAHRYKIEYLKKKCRSFLEINCDAKNVAELVLLFNTCNDQYHLICVLKYILANDEEVFSTDEWQNFAEKHWSLAETCMLMKYGKCIIP